MVGEGFFCPMVKANAYGHGAFTISKRLISLGAKYLGVATVDEALEIGESAASAKVLVFSRFDSKSSEEVVHRGFVPVVSRFEDLELLHSHAKALGKKALVHIKLDTGIHRMGFALSEVDKICGFFKSHPGVTLDGVLTHLSHGEDAGQESGFSQKQIELFKESRARFQKLNPNAHIHCLNTHGLLSRSEHFSDLQELGARPGLGLYGVVEDKRLSKLPVMRVVSRVDHLQNVRKGEGVSYGWTWVAKRDSVVGVVPIGYADGYQRGFGNRTEMLIHGQRAPVVGTVCMDYVLLDVTEVSEKGTVKVGDEVVVLGEQGSDQISVNELAHAIDTLSYEVLTNFGRKIRLEES